MGNTLKFVQGNEACVEAALYAGLDFFAGYPITPSTEIAELLAYRLPQSGGKFIQMEDEIASLCAIIGASLTGRKVLTATSGPGFSLMQEALGYAIMTEIPCVIANVQRGGPSTGIPTHVSQGDVNQARWGTHGDHAISHRTPVSHAPKLIAMHIRVIGPGPAGNAIIVVTRLRLGPYIPRARLNTRFPHLQPPHPPLQRARAEHVQHHGGRHHDRDGEPRGLRFRLHK